VPATAAQAAAELHGAPEADDWIALSASPLPTEVATAWVVRPDCGAVVSFLGTVRDHTEGRHGVSELTYEAYPEVARRRMAALAHQARGRWPGIGRVVVWHRRGTLAVTEVAVMVAVSAPHRQEAFEAARWLIDEVKAGVPIWKQETWAGGRGWGTDARPIAEPAAGGS
jgi:molybdopterin synthase catalytic subunit